MFFFFVFTGFNSAETKIQTPDGKVWNEVDFRNLSREIYKDTSHHFPGIYVCIYRTTQDNFTDLALDLSLSHKGFLCRTEQWLQWLDQF